MNIGKGQLTMEEDNDFFKFLGKHDTLASCQSKSVNSDKGPYDGIVYYSNKYKDKKWEKSLLENDFFDNLDAVIVLTEWDIYSCINWGYPVNKIIFFKIYYFIKIYFTQNRPVTFFKFYFLV